MIGVVMRLYPRAVRQRYGQEIAEMLSSSRSPVRDVADVTQAALAERWHQLATQTSGRQLGARAAVWLGWAVIPGVAGMLLLFCVGLVPVLTTLIAWRVGVWLADNRVSRGRVAAATGGLTLAYSYPYLAQYFGGVDSTSELVSMALFVVAAVPLVVVTGVLLRAGHQRAAHAAAVIGGLATLEGLTIASVTLGMNHPPGEPLLWYPMTMLPYGPWDWMDGTSVAGRLGDYLVYLPGAQTLILALALAYLCRSVKARGAQQEQTVVTPVG